MFGDDSYDDDVDCDYCDGGGGDINGTAKNYIPCPLVSVLTIHRTTGMTSCQYSAAIWLERGYDCKVNNTIL